MALDAKFTAAARYGTGKVVVNFKDQSAGSPTSWNWDFGDGTTSTMRNPTHIYYTPGVYTVSLTVANASGTSTETETDYIYLAATPVFCDNATLYKPAWVKTSMSPTSTQKIAINMADYRMKPEDMKYARLFWATCSSAQYFLDTFKQGIVFCTTTSIEDYTAVDYIQNYMQGLSDADNLVKLNNIVPGAFVMVDFSKKPPSLQ
jgi:PKD repeat protein